MDGIVAVTFTEKAAGELKLRLREALEIDARARNGRRPTRRRLEDGARRRSKKRTSARFTASAPSCCANGRSKPASIRCSPCLTEPQAERLYARAFRAWLQDVLEDPPAGRAACAAADERPGVRRPGRQRSDRAAARRRLDARRRSRDFTHPWTAPAVRSRSRGRSADRRRCIDLAEMSRGGLRQGQPVQVARSRSPREPADSARAVARPARSRRVGIAAHRSVARSGPGARPGRDTARSTARSRAPTSWRRATRSMRICCSSAPTPTAIWRRCCRRRCRRRRRSIRSSSAGRARSTSPICSPARATCCARTTRCARHLQHRFTRIFVDEFQDTDPVQAEILLLLAADDDRVDRWTDARPTPGKLFIVGDPKQAIYRFRGADVGTYWSVRNHLERVRRTRAAADDELPQRAGDPAVRQSRVRAGDDRQRDGAAGRLRAAGGTSSRRRLAAGGGGAAGAGAVFDRPPVRQHRHRQGRRGVAAGRRWRVHRVARARQRMAGAERQPGRRPKARRHPAAAHRRALPPVHQLHGRHDAARTSRRSRRAASRTCSSAARRFTIAKRSKRFAPRWRRSNGPTTSCRCSRR